MDITLKAARVLKNLTQEEAAKLLNISESTLNHYENQKYSPRLSTLQKMAEIYEVDIKDFKLHDKS